HLKALFGARFRLHLRHFRLLSSKELRARLGMPFWPAAPLEAVAYSQSAGLSSTSRGDSH
ncbi:MAG: hypothetical protein O3A97_10385, partial [Proteobacteria bacterium]|nr:hypothetical protein [Pseudomonadota bacterium]